MRREMIVSELDDVPARFVFVMHEPGDPVSSSSLPHSHSTPTALTLAAAAAAASASAAAAVEPLSATAASKPVSIPIGTVPSRAFLDI